jgi:hypothetical protein
MKPRVWPFFKVPYFLKFEWCPPDTDKMESPFFVAAHKNVCSDLTW